MAGPLASNEPRFGHSSDMEDPFVSTPAGSQSQREIHRYASFENQLFTLDASSPSQVKRALEAHLAETERRLQDASKLGTALVKQQKELSDKLKDIEKQQEEGEIGPDLRRKLADLEKEYNDIGRETARASLGPKPRLMLPDDPGQVVPSLDGRLPASPSVFSSQATSSPSKVSVPSRKQRNQPSSRVHDIEFATEISTSLLAQVRQLQALLAEREETLKTVTLEKSRLELEAEGFSQRLRALDDSEQRYKDENWSLETQTHELMAAAKEAAAREARLTSSLNAVTTEKNNAQRELDELKQANGKLSEDSAAAQKAYDSELHVLRRNLTTSDTERSTLQRKVEELTSQNQELAKAVATRFRQNNSEATRDLTFEDEGQVRTEVTPENSPPPSPSKATPRHGHLESETLKSSLHHAHRMIQNLRNNIHREKTEKIELKRMLQDARNELEQNRGDGPASATKRQKTKPDAFKKPARPDMLGSTRRTEIEIEEPDWEDQPLDASPSRKAASRQSAYPHTESASDNYQTANETEDAFETATEREPATESEAFQTGAESLAGESSDELTETESRATGTGISRNKKPQRLASISTKPGDRTSYMSTASTSDDEYDDAELRTPIQPQPQRYRLKMNRVRRGRPSGEVPESGVHSAGNSPASFANSPATEAPQGGQSLFAELEELEGAGSDDEFGTPSRSNTVSQVSTPVATKQAVPQPSEEPAERASEVVMVDSAMMTEPWEPVNNAQVVTSIPEDDKPTVGVVPEPTPLVDSSTQYTPVKSSVGSTRESLANLDTPPKTIWDEPALEKRDKPGDESSAAIVPEPRRELHVSSIFSQETSPVDVATERQPRQPSVHLGVSGINSEETQPSASSAVAVAAPAPASAPALGLSSVQTAMTEPSEPTSRPLEFSSITSQETTPIEPVMRQVIPPAPVPVPLPVSSHEGEQELDSDSPSRPKTAVREDEAPRHVDEPALPKDPSSPASVREQSIEPTSVVVDPVPPKSSLPFISSEIASQTILTAEQIDKLLLDRSSSTPSSNRKQNLDVVNDASDSPSTTPRARPPPSVLAGGRPRDSSPTPQAAAKRPGSAGSQRRTSASHPPLPPDHKQAIAAAQRMSSDATTGSMGPPLAPASAYRTNIQRPRTPNEQARPGSATKITTPRTVMRRGSQRSRRSSISSFASEIEERFNLQPPTGVPGDVAGYPLESVTDPRMIQAITQTMIGEFLWKYTRKTGRTEMSSSRHQRYFWVNPFTRTLYWSDQNPQIATKPQLKAKSVPIEAVRVVTDDNPYPPGLHYKSLEIVTPSRIVRFTAPTSQRHETWYNALSYLLLRTSDEGDAEDQENNLTAEDVDEFNPGASSRRRSGSRMSFSSRASRASRTRTSKAALESSIANRRYFTPGYTTPSLSSRHDATVRGDQARQSSASRIGTMFRNSGMKGTFSSRRSRYGPTSGSMDSTSGASRDSAEESRRLMERQEREAGRLENVRACCDGKHDVSSLSRTNRYGSRASYHSHVHK